MTRLELKNKLWGIANSRADLKSKIQFYVELINEMGGTGFPFNNDRYIERVKESDAELNTNILWFEKFIEPLDANECAILRLRYMHGVRWEQVNRHAPYYSSAQARRIHDRALDKILENISKFQKYEQK